MQPDRQYLVDGTLLPCWSWASEAGLYSGKHKTTGMNVQVVCTLEGELVWISDPITLRNQTKGMATDPARLRSKSRQSRPALPWGRPRAARPNRVGPPARSDVHDRVPLDEEVGVVGFADKLNNKVR